MMPADVANLSATLHDAMRKNDLAVRRPFAATSIGNLIGDVRNPSYIVEGLIEEGTLAVVFGAEGTRKSFLMTDLALCIGDGRPWANRRTKKSAVLYLAGEGRSGILRRVKGWMIRKGKDTPDVYLADRFVPLIGAGDCEDVCRWIEAQGTQFGLIFLDTIARAMAGRSENDSQDVGLFVANLDMLRERTGAAVIGIHHTPLEARNGKSPPRPRGSTALPGAADTLLAVEYDNSSGIAAITTCKQKDGSTDGQLCFRFDIVEVGGTDNFGNPVTTLVPDATDEKLSPKPRRLGRWEQIAHDHVLNAGSCTRVDLVKHLVDCGQGKTNAHRTISDLIKLEVFTNPCGIIKLERTDAPRG
jgi:putative DNA primase/helicase